MYFHMYAFFMIAPTLCDPPYLKTTLSLTGHGTSLSQICPLCNKQIASVYVCSHMWVCWCVLCVIVGVAATHEDIVLINDLPSQTANN